MTIKNLVGEVAKSKLFRWAIKQKSREEIHKYWSDPNDQYNSPELYFEGEDRSKFLVEIMKRHLPNKDVKILEIGCNVGRNLNFLFNAGYKNLEGIELNTKAIDLMKSKYPAMSKVARIYNSTIEDKIRDFKDSQFEVTFSMAVLMNIHRDSEWIFNELVRITKDYLITIEDEHGVSLRNFPRNYKTIFENLGMKEIEAVYCKDTINIDGHARIFKHSN